MILSTIIFLFISSEISQKSIFPFFILGFIGFGIFRTLGDIGINKTGLAFGLAS